MKSAIFKTDLEKFKLYETGEHTVYAIPALKVMELASNGYLKTWSGNRPPDPMRISEIREYHAKTRSVSGVIHLAFITSRNEGFVCYEGNHRRNALVPEIEQVLVDIMWDVTNDRVHQEFTAINQAVSVPAAYTDRDFNAHAKTEAEKFVNEFAKKYKKCASASPRPQSPNFNKDMLLQNILEQWGFQKCPIQDLLDAIDALNEKYKNDPRITKQKIIDKCAETGCWLFAREDRLDGYELAKLINKTD